MIESHFDFDVDWLFECPYYLGRRLRCAVKQLSIRTDEAIIELSGEYLASKEVFRCLLSLARGCGCWLLAVGEEDPKISK